MMIRFLRALWPFLAVPARRRLLLGSAGSAIIACLDALGVTLVLPLARLMTVLDQDTLPPELQTLGDTVGITDPSDLAAVLAVTVVGCFVLKGVLALVVLRSTLKVALDAEAAMAGRLLRGYLGAPLEFHLQHNSAELQRTIHESTRRVYQEALVTSVPALGDQLVLVAITAVLLLVAPVEAVVGGLFMIGLVALYRRLTARRAAASSDELLEESRRSIQYVQETIGAVREIKISGRVERFAQDLLDVRERVASRQRTLTLTEVLPRYYLELGIVIGAALIGAVAFARRPPDDAIAVLALFLAAALRLLPSLNRVLVAEVKARVAMPNLARIAGDLTELDEGNEHQPQQDPDPLPATDGFRQLQLSDIHFRYRSRPETALCGVNLDLARGDRVVFVGRSGSGKTTALNIVLGLLDPEVGTVLVNGRPLEGTRRAWQSRIAYVPQEVAILDASVLENVAFGAPAASIDRSRAATALRQARLDEVVAGLPHGIDTEVGEGGSRFSGGQRQRLGLARALYQEPEVLVLDEATSALDAVTEAELLNILEELDREVTIVSVAHRIAAIRRFDRICLFENGRITATGTFDQLLAEAPAFATLVHQLAHEPKDQPGSEPDPGSTGST